MADERRHLLPKRGDSLRSSPSLVRDVREYNNVTEDDDVIGCSTGRCHSLTVEPILLLYFMAFVMYWPTLGLYVYYIIGKQHGFNSNILDEDHCATEINTSDPRYILQEQVQAESAQFMMLQDIASLLPATVVTVLLGPYSDRHGRKLPMVITLTGSVIKALIVIVVMAYELDKYYLLIGTLLEGCCGGMPAMMMALFTYITDVTTLAQRSRRIFILDVTLHIGSFAGDLFFGLVLKETDYLWTMLVIQGIHVVAFMLVVLYLRESISSRDDKVCVSEGHLLKMSRLFLRDETGQRHWKLRLSLLVLFLVSMVELGGGVPLGLNLVGAPLCFTVLLIALFSLTGLVAKVIFGSALIKAFLSRLRETGLMILGSLFEVASFVIMAFASTKLLAFLVPIVGGSAVVTIPMARSVASKLVRPEEQGALFGSIAITQNLAAIVGSCLFNSVYTKTILFMQGFVFLVYAGLLLLTCVFAIILHQAMGRHKVTNLASSTV